MNLYDACPSASADHPRMLRTINPGTLIVQSAYPDPPFDLMRDGIATGFDLELMRAVCRRLRLELRTIALPGRQFQRHFRRLDSPEPATP
jgi:hypothetical protein